MIKELLVKYKDSLKEYTYVNKSTLSLLCKGGYVKYIDNNHNLQYGGILIGIKYKNIPINMIDMTHKPIHIQLVLKKDKFIYTMHFLKYHILYKSHKTANDKLRDYFLSTLDETID